MGAVIWPSQANRTSNSNYLQNGSIQEGKKKRKKGKEGKKKGRREDESLENHL